MLCYTLGSHLAGKGAPLTLRYCVHVGACTGKLRMDLELAASGKSANTDEGKTGSEETELAVGDTGETNDHNDTPETTHDDNTTQPQGGEEDSSGTQGGGTGGAAAEGSDTTSKSIYLDEEVESKKVVKKAPTRMTRAQKAAMESLKSFGGAEFGSLSVKKKDLRSELKTEAEKRKREGGEEGEGEPTAKRPKTRLQRAQEEAMKNFADTPLGDGVKKYPKVTLAKRAAASTTTSAAPPNTEPSPKRQSRVQKSKAAAIESFGGASLDDLPVKKKPRLQSAHKYSLIKINTKSNSRSKPKPPATTTTAKTRLTRVEKARMEAISSFGGSTLDNVLESSKVKISRTDLDTKQKQQKKASGDEDGGEGEGDSKEGGCGGEKENVELPSPLKEEEGGGECDKEADNTTITSTLATAQ